MNTLTVAYFLLQSALGVPFREHVYNGPQAKPVVLPDGFLADTHDVASAKNAHLSALAKAAVSDTGYVADHGHEGVSTGYHGPPVIPKVLPDGHIADTHEVSAAKHAHFSAVANAKSSGAGYGEGHTEYDGGHKESYHGPVAKPVVLPSGHLADTHEVAAAKGAHLQALSQAQHSSSYSYGDDH